MLGTPGSYRVDDSGMAPSSYPAATQQPAGAAPPWAGMTLAQLGLSTPFMNQFQATDRPRLAARLWAHMQGNQQPGTTPAPTAPAAPAAWTPAQPQGGARLGQLFSGYGY